MKKIICFSLCLQLLLTASSQNFQDNVSNESLNMKKHEQSPSAKKPFYNPDKFKINPRLLFKKLPIKQPPTENKIYIDFVGTGDIQKSISEGQAINANTGLGIIHERYNSPKSGFQSLEFEAFINIFTTADTIVGELSNSQLTNRRNFSTYLLNPVSVKQSVFLNSNYYFGYPGGFAKISRIVSGFNVRFIASNNVWKLNEDTVRNLGGLYFRAGIFHELIPDNYRVDENGRSKYSCFFGINYTHRGMYGDLSSNENKEARKRFLGTDVRSFSGLELDFGFRLNNIRAEFQMPMLSGKKVQVQGLTNTQFLFSIKFVGGFSLKLTPKESAETATPQTVKPPVNN